MIGTGMRSNIEVRIDSGTGIESGTRISIYLDQHQSARGRPIIVEWERRRHSAGLSFVSTAQTLADVREIKVTSSSRRGARAPTAVAEICFASLNE
ncbi:hypothetical protein EVAR_89118_1 [Eumeta japonica]|uniref:Uncharacterized protein n=1 Tax=Eumeta variegata TaxID=151549 RepID=A0A4C1ZND3_EUMVA|nr:hypothetical protein EVAR_89118_1 [Eumeta japonica]